MNKTGLDYVHGYAPVALSRLQDQARTLADLLHHDTRYPPGAHVLEAGCGAGAQTVLLAERSPQATFTCVDVNESSLATARDRCTGLNNARFIRADVRSLPFPDATFDHVFVCFVLEHLARPDTALDELIRTLRPGGTLTAIEGDHGSVLMHPDNRASRAAIACQVRLQRRARGEPMIGRRLFPLLAAAGLGSVHVEPRTVYADATRPGLVDGFVHRTFTAMIADIEDAAVDAGWVTRATFAEGIAGLRRCTEPDGAFAYTFFKAVGVRPEAPPR